ncbi:MAG: WecB/TagA/CpsF family glycosyltransferase, partial [Dehalococcoidia bacterium]|nr:WecB/TagA/CpsF family glycosyltransferase [Dehalococcoidia bacterium]
MSQTPAPPQPSDPRPPTRARRVLGVRVDDVTYEETIALCRAWIAQGGSHQIATVNPEFVMLARRDPAFAATLEAADLAVPDGVGLLLACRWAGAPLREAVHGVDLLERLAAVAAVEGWRLFFLGGRHGVGARAAAALAARYPGLAVAGVFEGDAEPSGDAATTAAIRAAGRVDLLFVAYGAPRQDRWIARNASSLGIPVSVGVGGAFDYLSGAVPRAPRWVTDAGFEWLYRLGR